MREAILLGCLAGLATVLGIVMVKMWHERALLYSHYINSFAAGLIVTAALSALLPDALRMNPHASLYAVGGFAAFLTLENFLVMHSGAEVHYSQASRSAARGMVFFWGLFLHSFLDGLVIAVGFATSARIGLVTALAVIGHEVPEGVTTFSLLLRKISERKTVVLSLAVAVATPVGVLVGLPLLPALEPSFMGAAVAAVAGSFLYLAASDIVPEIREEKALQNTAFLLLGVVFMALIHHLLGD